MKTFEEFDGALLVDKPCGPTSHDIVATVRRHFQFEKVGHAGTLDPNATGLLILLLGKGTKLSEKLMGSDKIYEGTARFGETTDSYDCDGEIVSSLPVPPLTLDELNAYADQFNGDQMQIPPMHSAIKKDGVPLYKLARKGVEVERKPKLIRIYKFRFTAYNEPEGQFRVACTKGTYIRSLIHDLGQKVGCGAHLSQLRRVGSGQFDVKDALSLDQITALTPKDLSARVIPFLKLSSME
ncbi:MAG TPA: tRNA pseudouridine(55) synthase TruB [Verrucomicrobiae bacterium]